MDKWGTEEQPQTVLQWQRMLYQRDYRKKIKENEIIYIKKSNIINKTHNP